MKILVIDYAEQLAPFFVGLDAEVVCFSDEVKALNAVEELQPELIFLDFELLGEQTPEYIGLLLDAVVAAKLVVVGVDNSEDDVFRCLLKGANGYQNMRQLSDYLEKLIRVVSQGEAWISRKMVARVLDAIRSIEVEP